MSPIIPDLKSTAFGISSPRSRTEGYSCAFPSWPNRPWLDSRAIIPEPIIIRQSMPSLEFMEGLRRRPRPESVFDEDDDSDDDDEYDCAIAESLPSSTNSNVSSGTTTPNMLPGAQPGVQRSNSLLSRAFSQMHNNGRPS